MGTASLVALRLAGRLRTPCALSAAWGARRARHDDRLDRQATHQLAHVVLERGDVIRADVLDARVAGLASRLLPRRCNSASCVDDFVAPRHALALGNVDRPLAADMGEIGRAYEAPMRDLYVSEQSAFAATRLRPSWTYVVAMLPLVAWRAVALRGVDGHVPVRRYVFVFQFERCLRHQ